MKSRVKKKLLSLATSESKLLTAKPGSTNLSFCEDSNNYWMQQKSGCCFDNYVLQELLASRYRKLLLPAEETRCVFDDN